MALWPKDFHTSYVNVSAVFSNLRCKCPEELSRRNFPRKIFPSTFILTIAECSQTFSIFFRLAFHKIQFSFLEQNVGIKNCLKKGEFNIFFRILIGRISHFGRNCWGSFLKTALTYQEENFGGNCFQKNLVSCFYSVLELKHFVLWLKIFSSLLKTGFYVYRWLFWNFYSGV